MIRQILLVCAITAALVAASPSSSRVVNGKDAKPGQFPYQALVYVHTSSGTALCGGVCKYWPSFSFFQVKDDAPFQY